MGSAENYLYGKLTEDKEKVFRERKEVLMDILLRDRSLETIVHKAAEMVKCPIILTTSSYRVIVQDDLGYEVDDPVWKRAKEFGYCDAQSVALFETEGITRKVLAHENAFLLDRGVGEKIPRILHKVKYFNKTGAYIGVFQVNHVFESVDFITTDLLCDIISIMLERDPGSLYLGSGIRESIISDLIDGSLTSSTILNDRIYSACWKILPIFQCAMITSCDKAKGIDNAEYLAYLLRNHIRNAQTLHVPEGIFLLMNFRNEGGMENYRAYIEEIAEKYSLYVNISAEFYNLISLKDQFETCMLIRETAKERRIPDKVICFTDIVFECLGEKLGEKERCRFMQTKYGILHNYDTEHGTDYCHTLITYIECGCSSTAACTELFIHRNTMTKRLNRICEICGIDGANGRELLHFYLTAKFMGE